MTVSAPPADEVHEALAQLLLDHPSVDLPAVPNFSSSDPKDVMDVRAIVERILAAFEVRPRGTVAEAEPFAWAIYGQVTGNLKQVTTSDEVAEDCREHFTVRPLFLGEVGQ